MGVVLERSWIVPTIRGDIVVLSLKTASPERTLVQLAESERPFDRWFRQRILGAYDLDVVEAGGIVAGEEVFTWQQESSVQPEDNQTTSIPEESVQCNPPSHSATNSGRPV